jgi:hypothetical protein
VFHDNSYRAHQAIWPALSRDRRPPWVEVRHLSFVAALAREGSMGFVALMHMPEAEVRQLPSGYIDSGATGGGDRLGVNLTLASDQMHRLDAALEAGCRIISLWQGDPRLFTRAAPRTKTLSCSGLSRALTMRRALPILVSILWSCKAARQAAILSAKRP